MPHSYYAALIATHTSFHMLPNHALQVLSVSSLEHKNIDDVWESMQEYHSIMESSGRLHQNRNQQSKTWMWQMITGVTLSPELPVYTRGKSHSYFEYE